MCSFSWLSNIPLLYVPQLLYPFICRWTSRWLLCSSYCKQCCTEQWDTCVFFNFGKASISLLLTLAKGWVPVALVTLDNLGLIAQPPWRWGPIRMSALSAWDGNHCTYLGDHGWWGIRVWFQRGSLRNGYHIRGRQQVCKLPTPDRGR